MPGEWYFETAKRIEELKHRLLPREVKEYQIDKLKSIARRVDEFAPCDPVCRGYQQVIEQMVAELSGAPLPYARDKVYMCTIGEMIGHLKKSHGLVNESEYLGLWLVIGMIAGGIIGLFIGNTPPATGTGLIIGLIIGLLLDARARRQSKVI